MKGIKENIWEEMNKLHSSFSKIFDRIIKNEEITKNQALVLIAIERADDICIQKLSFLVELNQGNTSTTCKKLEQMGYLKRVRSKEDERIVNVMLENKGKELIKRITNKFSELEKYIETFENSKIESIINGINNSNELLQYLLEKFEN